MFTLRGDAHRFFLRIRKRIDTDQKVTAAKEIIEIDSIISFYESLTSSNLKKMKYYMLKEQNGSGAIPLAITTLPWLFFMFSKPLTDWLLGKSHFLIFFVVVYVGVLVIGIFLHFHEKAWARVHLEVIEDVLGERAQSKDGEH
ncbi:hypothetical protein [Bacillus fonticola]|uniref:hypothetical protein n=1 Tax=Bacillus fonticola TaxID=2728853 RepID=UPI001475B6F6|nr:hypothetical protein [Bacillus fonticola]